ncbi:inactive pancreatic lipase-related protein 1-like isoform X2 [Anabrus simplex]|uniref:inactive pancreatic lipase-related protein 1-like isoform X2 n=1 Tax=Anabrus simplex TaxID=316456 RepID=UPI0035A39027
MRILYSVLLFHMLVLGEFLHFSCLLPPIFRHSNAGKHQVCYDEVGCFSTLPPWNRTVYRENNIFFSTKAAPPPRSPESLNTTISLYTRETNQNGTTFYSNGSYHIPPHFNRQRKIYIIVHGYDGSSYAPYLQLLKNNLLEEDVNVLMVNWGTLSGPENYAQSVSDTRVVGVVLARFIVYLRKNLHDDLYFHLIGHSLGAQICGYAGKELTRRGCQPVQRITGADPAGIGFIPLPPENRLSPGDAVFVDVIHTDRYMLGINESLGDVDFVMNGGHYMPECSESTSAEINKTEAAQKMHVCSHVMAVNYLADALTARNCRYWGVQANSGPCDSGESKALNVESLMKACERDECSTLDDPLLLPARGTVDVDTRRYCSRSEMEFLQAYKQYRQRKFQRVTN